MDRYDNRDPLSGADRHKIVREAHPVVEVHDIGTRECQKLSKQSSRLWIEGSRPVPTVPSRKIAGVPDQPEPIMASLQQPWFWSPLVRPGQHQALVTSGCEGLAYRRHIGFCSTNLIRQGAMGDLQDPHPRLTS
jgi:hypothetical protein